MAKMKEKYTHRPQVEYPQEVGTFYPKMLTYNDCKKDIDGYIDPLLYLPLPLDLVYVNIQRNKEKLSKNFIAWWTGTHWDGSKILPEDKILKWRKKGDNNEF